MKFNQILDKLGCSGGSRAARQAWLGAAKSHPDHLKRLAILARGANGYLSLTEIGYPHTTYDLSWEDVKADDWVLVEDSLLVNWDAAYKWLKKSKTNVIKRKSDANVYYYLQPLPSKTNMPQWELRLKKSLMFDALNTQPAKIGSAELEAEDWLLLLSPVEDEEDDTEQPPVTEVKQSSTGNKITPFMTDTKGVVQAIMMFNCMFGADEVVEAQPTGLVDGRPQTVLHLKFKDGWIYAVQPDGQELKMDMEADFKNDNKDVKWIIYLEKRGTTNAN